MANPSSQGASVHELELENARLRTELAEARERHIRDSDAIRNLLTNGSLLDEEELQSRIAAGGPCLPQLLELQREMAKNEEAFREIIANPVPLRAALNDAERRLGADHAH